MEATPGGRHDAERADWQSERLREVLDQLTDAVVAVDREFRLVHANAVALRMIGKTLEEVVGVDHWDLLPSLRETVVWDEYHRAMRTGEPAHFDYQSPRTGRWIEARAFPAPDGLVFHLTDVTDRRQAEASRERRERLVRTMLDAIPQIAWAADLDGTPTYFNERWYAYTGLGRDDPYDATLFVHADDAPVVMARRDAALAQDAAYEAPLRIRRADGEFRWHLTRAEPMRGDDGRPTGYMGTSTDVHEATSRERILAATHELSEFAREAARPEDVMAEAQRIVGERLGASRVAYAEVDAEGRFHGVPNFCVDCEDLDGRYPVSGLSSEVAARLRAGKNLILDDVARGAASIEGLSRLLDVGMAAILCVPISVEGRVVAILGVHQTRPRSWSSDETALVLSMAGRCWAESERVRAARELRRSEQRMRRILEAATVGVAVNRPDGTFTYANPPLLAMLGFSPEELAAGALSWERIQLPELRYHDDLALAQLRATGACEPYETELLRRDGTRVPVYVGAALVPDEGGEGLLGAAFLSDLTALKENERQLATLAQELDERVRARTAELERANRDLNEFSYSVAHDLRAPLRAIVSTSRILLEDAADRLEEEERELLERQAKNAVRLAAIVDDLLAFARLAKADIRKEPFDMTALASGIAAEVRGRRASGCEVRVQEGMRSVGDPSLVGYALTNLIDNACKFSPAGGTVTVGEADGRYFVRDEGVGFDMSHAHKLFVAFERLVDQEAFEGTGVGLANVKRIVERHGGEVGAQSAPGMGATFWFTLG